MATTTQAPATGGLTKGKVKHYKMLIGGEWKDAKAGEIVDSVNPATEEVIATFPHAKEADVQLAVDAAKEGFKEWRTYSWVKRAKIMREFGARMAERVEHFAVLDVQDSGNPIGGMRGDAQGAPSEFYYFAGISSELKGTTYEAPAGVVASSYREPFGVVGRIIPFNHPYRFCAKVSPIIAAGNAVILKPAEATSLSAFDFAEMTLGLFPPGVINVVSGLGVTTGAAIVKHPDVPRIAFTGGVPTGKAIAKEAAENMKRCSFELGGKNPMIVFPDVDVAKAAVGCVKGMNLARSMGQSCQSNSRVFVHEKIYDKFLEELVKRVESLKVDDPMNEDADMGALAYEGHYKRVMSFIDSGKEQGARLLTGGRRPARLNKGFFVEPTVFAGASNQWRMAREEIFGPVMVAIPWEDEAEAIRMANDSHYGLAAYVWTHNIRDGIRTAHEIEAGWVQVNQGAGQSPGHSYGGYKQSGLGREFSLEGMLDGFTQRKSVTVSLAQ
jgi:betaine-aldehyde dehydrogenase